MKDLTFIIPVRIDSEERMLNLLLVDIINFLILIGNIMITSFKIFMI